MIITQVDVLMVIVYKKQTQLLVLLCYQGLLQAKIFVLFVFFFSSFEFDCYKGWFMVGLKHNEEFKMLNIVNWVHVIVNCNYSL